MTNPRKGPAHNRYRHGMTTSSTYKSWSGMKARCYKTDMQDYPKWGGRGITVCDRWRNSFECFLADMGEKPDGVTLERINNDGNYEPANCRWATRTDQSRNRGYCRVDEFKARRIRIKRAAGATLEALSREYGIAVSHVHRIALGEAWA